MSQRIIYERFDGIVPRRHPQKLDRFQAQVAENVDLLSLAARTFKEPLLEKTLASDIRKTVYFYNGGFLEFDEDVDVVENPNPNDTFKRIFFTSETGKPQVIGLTGSGQKQLDLGIPKPSPKPTVATQAKTTGAFTREWKYFYEEQSGLQVDNGTLTEGVDVIETVIGESYNIPSIPAKVAASATAKFIAFFTAKDLDGNNLGTVYPETSIYKDNNNFFFNGAKVSMSLVEVAGPAANITLSYNTDSGTTFVLDKTYVYTFIGEFGEEGPPTEASSLIAVTPNQDVLVSGMATSATGTLSLKQKKIYRTVLSTSGQTEFRLVATVDIADTTFTDTLTDAQIPGDLLISTTYLAPPSDLKGLVLHPQGFAAGFTGRSVYLSVIGELHAYPAEFIYSTKDEIVGLGITINTIAIMTKGRPESLTGQAPDAMAQDRYELRQACESKRSIVDVNGVIMYACPDGLAAMEGTAGRLVTEKHYRREEWQALLPKTMISEVHDRKYYGFSDAGFIIFDFDQERSAFATTSITVQGLYSDEETDTLFLIQGSQLTKWNQGTNKLTLKYRGREELFKDNVTWAVGELVADGYPMTMRLYANNTLVFTKTVTDSEIFRCIPLRPNKIWSVEFEGSFDVTRACIATSATAIARAS